MDNEGVDVMFCLPGNKYSGKFLDCWTALMMYCIEKGISYGISRGESASLYHVRNLCLGGNPHKGEKQKIFNGIPVKRIMWIDSDQIFNPESFQMLMDEMDKDDSIDVITGHYMMSGLTGFAVWEELDEMNYKVHGNYKCITPPDLEDRIIPYSVEFAGLGWCLMKATCFDKLPYPWMRQAVHKVGKSIEITFEDFKFFQDMKKMKKKCMAHPKCIVGHLKPMVI